MLDPSRSEQESPAHDGDAAKEAQKRHVDP
jgi:hypothetical protein